MLTALLFGVSGLILSWVVGSKFLAFDLVQVLKCIGASNASGLATVLLVLELERLPWVKKHLFTRVATTWFFFYLFYFAGMLALSSELRSIKNLLFMLIPVILSNGFCIIVFGPIRDWMIRRRSF